MCRFLLGAVSGLLNFKKEKKGGVRGHLNNMEMIYLILSQFTFSFSRTLNVRYTAKENVLMGIITSTLIKLTWLVSSSIGVKSVIDGDVKMCIAYVVSGLIGDYLSYKIKIK